MLYIKNPRFFAIGIPILLILFTMNHLEYHYRQKAIEKQSKEQNQIVVRIEGASTGHNTIAIDDGQLLSNNDSLFLHFAMLGDWAFDPKSPSPCPENIKALSGQEASCIGFMYPLEAGDRIKAFCLLRSTQTCCYGPRPQYNQYIFVEMKEPVKFERLAPVLLKGKFFVDPQPDQGFIYRMEGISLSPVGNDAPEIDAVKAAQEANLPRFDFQPLEAFEKNQANGLPRELVVLNGKQVVLDGYLVYRSKDVPPQILLGSKWWDGVSKGTPPTLFNAVMVFPKDTAHVPQLWKQKGVFTGTLHFTSDAAQWPKTGIVSLHDAVIGVPGTTKISTLMDSGPYLPIFIECLIIIAFLMKTLKTF